MDADGANRVQITHTKEFELGSAWAPDGSAFLTTVGDADAKASEIEIAIVQSDGSNSTRLTSNNVLDTAPAWSPDSSLIVYSAGKEGELNLFIMKRDGSEKRQPPAGKAFMPGSFVFVDESGSLAGRQQRFFALGLLKLLETHVLTEAAHAIQQVAQSVLSRPGFEFKFNSVRNENLAYHLALVDAYFDLPASHMSALVLDKQNPSVRWQDHFDCVWDAYIGYSRTLLANSIRSGEEVAVLADYLGKPRKSSRYYEIEVAEVTVPGETVGCVFNVCMIESHASLLVQVVDVLLGAVRYSYHLDRVACGKGKEAKIALVERVQERLGWTSLAQAQACRGSRHFSVVEYAPKNEKGEPSG